MKTLALVIALAVVAVATAEDDKVIKMRQLSEAATSYAKNFGPSFWLLPSDVRIEKIAKMQQLANDAMGFAAEHFAGVNQGSKVVQMKQYATAANEYTKKIMEPSFWTQPDHVRMAMVAKMRDLDKAACDFTKDNFVFPDQSKVAKMKFLAERANNYAEEHFYITVSKDPSKIANMKQYATEAIEYTAQFMDPQNWDHDGKKKSTIQKIANEAMELTKEIMQPSFWTQPDSARYEKVTKMQQLDKLSAEYTENNFAFPDQSKVAKMRLLADRANNYAREHFFVTVSKDPAKIAKMKEYASEAIEYTAQFMDPTEWAQPDVTNFHSEL